MTGVAELFAPSFPARSSNASGFASASLYCVYLRVTAMTARQIPSSLALRGSISRSNLPGNRYVGLLVAHTRFVCYEDCASLAGATSLELEGPEVEFLRGVETGEVGALLRTLSAMRKNPLRCIRTTRGWPRCWREERTSAFPAPA
jgi:hypothetical protein